MATGQQGARGFRSVSQRMGGSFRPVAHLSCLRCGCARRPGQRRVPPIAVVFCSSPRLPLRSSSTPFALPLLSKLESIHPFLGFGRVLEIETRPSVAAGRVENRGRSRSFSPVVRQSTEAKKKGKAGVLIRISWQGCVAGVCMNGSGGAGTFFRSPFHFCLCGCLSYLRGI